jgi:hypothetical protein
MSKLIHTIIFLSFLLLPSISNAKDLPNFFKSIQQDAFFPNGISEWKLQKNIEGENYFLLQWENQSNHEITLKYREATPNTIQAVYQGMGEAIDKNIKQVGGNILTLNEFLVVYN